METCVNTCLRAEKVVFTISSRVSNVQVDSISVMFQLENLLLAGILYIHYNRLRELIVPFDNQICKNMLTEVILPSASFIRLKPSSSSSIFGFLRLGSSSLQIRRTKMNINT